MISFRLLFILTFSFSTLIASDDVELIEKGNEYSLSNMDVTGVIESNLTDLEAEPSSNILNCVSVISGDYTESITDYIIPGPDPIPVQRVYSSGECANGSLTYGWHMGKFGLLNRWKNENKEEGKGYRATIIGGGGSRMTYREVDDRQYKLQDQCIQKGLTNTSAGLISGRTNPLNDQLSSDKNKSTFTLITGAGVKSTFQREKHTPYYTLKNEKRPNGLTLHYDYSSKAVPEAIKSKNRDGLLLSGLRYDIVAKQTVTITASGNKKTIYHFKKIKDDYFLILANTPGVPEEHYSYQQTDKRSPCRLVRKSRPNHRYLEIEYFGKGDNPVPFGNVKLKEEDDPCMGRVRALKAPVGHDASAQYIYKFRHNIKKKDVYLKDGTHRYEIEGGNTNVYDVYNRLTRYHYGSDMRLNLLEKFTGEGPDYKLYSSEQLFWNGPYLVSRIFKTKEGWAQYCKQFDYDSRGNVWRENLWGNLSGFNTEAIHYPPSGVPEYNNCEIEFKLYTYSDDGLNLMTSMTEQNRAKTLFSFVPGTDLLASKLSGPIGSTKKREFFEYDSSGTVIKRIVDDGSSPDKNSLEGVTERHITVITPTSSFPYGLPAITEERYLDLATGSECLLQRAVQTFSVEGKPLTKEVFDCNNVFAYAERWEYDSRGNVVLHQDPLGRVSTKTYDANNNLIIEQGPSPDYHLEHAYDFSNRLISTTTVCADGLRLSEKHHYDLRSNRVATEDVYGNRTTFKADEFGRITETLYPQVLDDAGQPYSPISLVDYNELGFPNVTTDPNGATLVKHFTIKGNPYRIVYPDGSQETIVYNPDATVSRRNHKNGSYTIYEYDYQMRPVKEETYGPDGELLAANYKEYTGFRLLQETTLGGVVTQYQYDGAGRLIETRQGDTRTTFGYDTLGRQTITRTFYGPDDDDFVAAIQLFDVLNRVVEEREESSSGDILKKTQYEYDTAGNRCKTITYSQGKTSISTAKYDPFGQVVETVDALGNTTTTRYFYDHRNELGQCVAYNETTDPLGIVTAICKDAMGRIATVVKRNSMGAVIQQAIFSYDGNGNKTRQVDNVYASGNLDRQITTAWEYDSCNRLVALTQAVGTPEQQQTRIVYNANGEKESIVKPDGMQLFHTYDKLGRMKTISSSDGSIGYEYFYDLNSNPIAVQDLVANTATQREYDGNNRMVREELANGLSFDYTYDHLGRPLLTQLPDESSVAYSYQANRLTQVDRLDPQGIPTFTHSYADYDLGGLLLAEIYAGQAGTAAYTYDLLGRLTDYKHMHFNESVSGYDPVGNLVSRDIEDAAGKTPCTYKYDELSQLAEEDAFEKHLYASDSLYNRISKDGLQHRYNALNQLIDDGINQYTYDFRGNLITLQTDDKYTSYAYDALDRLVEVTDGTTQYRYAYDEMNRRISKTRSDYTLGNWVQTTALRYLYHAQNEVGAVDEQGRIVQYRTLGTGKGAEIGATVLIELEGNAYVPLHDHNGNIACLVEAKSGQVSETYHYTAFGEEEIFDADGLKTDISINPWRFSAKRFDEETRFIYFGRRYYAPWIGRWVTADPLGYDAGPNLYAYVLNNPLTHFDLYGLLGENEGFFSRLSSSISTLWQESVAWLRFGAQIPGVGVERLAFHLVPIPGVQDALRAVGTVMQGRCLCGFETWWDVKSAFGHLGLEERNSDSLVMLVNGVNNSFEEFMVNVAKVSEWNDNKNVHWCYNSSHGLTADALEWVAQRFGVDTHSVDMFSKYSKQLMDDVGGVGSTRKIHVYGHSQGCEIIDNSRHTLGDDYRKHFVVNAFGTPIQINDDHFASVANLVSSRDSVPWLDPVNMFKAIFFSSKNTVILQSQGLPFFDHSWNSDTYQNEFKKRLELQFKKD